MLKSRRGPAERWGEGTSPLLLVRTLMSPAHLQLQPLGSSSLENKQLLGGKGRWLVHKHKEGAGGPTYTYPMQLGLQLQRQLSLARTCHSQSPRLSGVLWYKTRGFSLALC